MQRVYIAISNDGDGHASAYFLDSVETFDRLLEQDPERWGMTEAPQSFSVGDDFTGAIYTYGDLR